MSSKRKLLDSNKGSNYDSSSSEEYDLIGMKVHNGYKPLITDLAISDVDDEDGANDEDFVDGAFTSVAPKIDKQGGEGTAVIVPAFELKTMNFGGWAYAKKETLFKPDKEFPLTYTTKWVCRYRRGEGLCKATAQSKGTIGDCESEKTTVGASTHTCARQLSTNGLEAQSSTGAVKEKENMKARCQVLAIEDLRMGPQAMAIVVMKEFEEKHKTNQTPFEHLTLASMESLIKKTRVTAQGDWQTAILSTELSGCGPASGESRPFLQFSLRVVIDDKIEQLIGRGHPQLLFETRGGRSQALNIFADATFKAVVKGFTQLLVLMAFLPKFDMYVPFMYVLMQSKKEEAYKHAIQQVVNACGRLLWAKTITCDFEMAMQTAMQEEFSEGVIIGCNFHWKQAIRRVLVKLGFDPFTTITELIGEGGHINLLTQIPICDILRKGTL